MMRKMALMSLVTTIVALVAVTPANAWTPAGDGANLQFITGSSFSFIDQGDGFYNYDFELQQVEYWRCDWPVTVVYSNNANCYNVKVNYFSGTDQCNLHSKMHNWCKDDYAAQWEWDKGARYPTCGVLKDAYHVRTYAHGGWAAYSASLGQYVVATTHYDDIHWTSVDYGWSEEASDFVLQRAVAKGVPSGNTAYDYYWLYNYEPPRWEGGQHYWDNDGWAHKIRIP